MICCRRAYLAAFLLFVHVAHAQVFAEEPASSLPEAAQPRTEDLRALADLLAKPEIQSWLRNPPQNDVAAPANRNLQERISATVDSAREQLKALVETAPKIPQEIGEARGRLMGELRQRPLLAVLFPVLIFAGLGFGCEWLYWRLTKDVRDRIERRWAETPRARLKVVGFRLLYVVGEVATLALSSIGAFMLFDWAPTLQRFVIAYLLVALLTRLAFVIARVSLSREDERFRLLPMSTSTAEYWVKWSTIVIGSYLLGHFTLTLLPSLQMEAVAQTFLQLAFGLLTLILALVAVWRAPSFDGKVKVWRRHPVATWLITLYSFGLFVTALIGTGRTFYAGMVLLIFGFSIRGVRVAVDHVYRPGDGTANTAETRTRPVIAAALERGICAILMIGCAYIIASILGFDLNHFADGDTWAMKLARGALNAAIILLVADCLWQVTKAWVERKLAEANSMIRSYGEEARRRARVRTLLPVLRNIFAIILVVIAVLMALSALGVDIGPLIAGAGVVGVAIGFGAQTLVKDIISGIFFLFDDAFRTGEYIESGAIGGTVEAFSVRSVKLRHSLGALHTVPLGSLSTITNYSRDWAVDQMMVNVTYDTDLGKVKAIVAEIGTALKEDPAFAPYIMEPLRLQGVETFGEYAIKICLRTMTRPGEQGEIRRKAYLMLKEAFDANGIALALPTVRVAGSGPQEAVAEVAGKAGVELVRAPKVDRKSDTGANRT